jgi:Flp pilus assembly protein TadG
MRCRISSSGRSRATSDRPSDRGYVTAESAVVIPSIVLLMGMLLWGLSAVATRTQCGDAARAGARAAARGESTAAVLTVARTVAPEGADIRVTRDGELFRVRVSADSRGPGPLGVSVGGEAVAYAEPE